MTTHRCNKNCSWKQTEDDLRALGFDLPELRRDCTAMDKANHQNRVSEALHEATARGSVRTCTKTDKVWDHKKNKPKV